MSEEARKAVKDLVSAGAKLDEDQRNRLADIALGMSLQAEIEKSKSKDEA